MVSEEFASQRRGDVFCGQRLPEFRLNRGDCTFQIIGRYMRCETHSLLPALTSSGEAPCGELSRQWNKSFRSGRKLVDESHKWSNTIGAESRARTWTEGVYLGIQAGKTSNDPSLHMLARNPGSSFSFPRVAADSDLVRMNNVVYCNILLLLGEYLGVDDYAAEQLYLNHPSLYRGGESVADYRELGVSPGLLAYLREGDREEVLPAARIIEHHRNRMGWPRGQDGDYQTYAVFNTSDQSPVVECALPLPPGEQPLDIFKERIPVYPRGWADSADSLHPERWLDKLPTSDPDAMCVAGISRSGRITCEQKEHSRHEFYGVIPGEVREVVEKAFNQRINDGARDPDYVPISRLWAKWPKLWRYIDQLPSYAGVAPRHQLLDYLKFQVPPEMVKKWKALGITDSKEVLWADLIHSHMKDEPIGYIGVLAMVLGRGSISAYQLASKDPAVLKKVIRAAETKALPINYNDSGLSARGITSGFLDNLPDAYPDWKQRSVFPHVKSVEARRCVPSIVKSELEEVELAQMTLGF